MEANDQPDRVETVDEPEELRGVAAIFGPFVNALFAPGRAFDALQQRPMLALWILLWTMVSILLLSTQTVDITRQIGRVGFIEQAAQGTMDAEQMTRVVERIDRMAPYLALLGNVFFAIMVALISLLIWIGSTLLGGSSKFGGAFGVASVASVAHPLVSTCFTVLVWDMKPPEIRRMSDVAEAVPTLGLDTFLGGLDVSAAVRTLLQRVDMFNIWWIVLVALGCERLMALRRGQGTIIGIVIWALAALFSAFVAWMGQS